MAVAMSDEGLTVPDRAGPWRIVMVGAAVPDDVMAAVMKADPAPEVQTQKLSWGIVRGIESNGKVVDLISTVTIKDYPKSDWLWSGYRKWDRGNGSANRMAPFINVFGLNHLTRFLGCAALLIRWSIANRGSQRHVFHYGLLCPHLYAVRFVRLFFSMKLTVLITDLPGMAIGSEPWWRRMLRPIDSSMIHSAARAADGAIVLTRQIGEDYLPEAPAMVMEGIVSVESEELAKTMPESSGRHREFVVLYAGALTRFYGIPLLLEAFAKLPGEGFRLWLYGGGDMAEEIRRWAEADPRVIFLGIVAPAEVFRSSQRATVLINPRPSHQRFTAYSFPSKLIEYMTTGRPVISTRLTCIPSEYDPYLVWLDHETPEALATLLMQLSQQPRDLLDQMGRRGRDFVLREKNYRRQGRRILEFMEHVNRLSTKKYKSDGEKNDKIGVPE